MEKYGAQVFWGIFALVSGFLLIIAAADMAFHPKAVYEIDHSTVNLVSLSDGTHPWLTLELQNDPADTDLRHLRWSPIGRTLAYLDNDVLRTWNPANSATLTGGKDWKGPFWSPNGEFIVVTSPEKTIIFNALTLEAQQELDGENTVWWSDDKLCYARLLNPNKRGKDDVQSFTFGEKEVDLPAGLSLSAASRDGKVLMAQSNCLGNDKDPGSFVLLGMDTKTGAVIWSKPAPKAAIHNFATPELTWNEKHQMATEAIDFGGGFDLHGFAQSGSNIFEIKFAKSADYSWLSGPMTWAGDELFAPMTLAKLGKPVDGNLNLKFWNELAFFNPQTHALRTVATGLDFEEAAASPDYVALLVPGDGEPHIVVTAWLKDANGKITGIDYKNPKPYSDHDARVASLTGSVGAKA